jgi:hypothetical protein
MKHSAFRYRFFFWIVAVVCLCLPEYSARAAEWQWSVADAGSQIYLWIPPNCERVRAVVLSNHNMTEQGMLEHPAMRKTLGELGIAEAFISPGLGVKFDFNNGDEKRFERIMNALAEESGYSELATAPIVPMGHSANATWVWNFAAWNPGRTLAVVSFHGDAPRTLLTGYGVANVDWGNRTIEGVPGLMIMGEYEWWNARMWPALVYTAKFPKTPIAFLADAGHGHFDYADRTVEFIAKFIAKAAAARLPAEMPQDKPVTLKPVDPKTGWLVDRWRRDQPPTAPAAPYAEYSGDTGEAFWCFDEEMAKQTEAIYAEQRGKKPQRIIVKDYSSAEGKAVGADNNPHGLVQEDGRTFRLSAEFAASDNGKPLGHATGGGPIRFSKIDGPVTQTGPDTFQFGYGRAEYTNDRRNNDVWIVAHHPGDAEYKSAVQQIKIYFPPNAGTEQHITFPAIGDQKADIKTLKLAATSDSGLPVAYYVVSGPAEIEGDTLRFTEIPPRAKFPVKVIVTAWQWGRATEPKVHTASPVTQEFFLVK